MFKNYVYRFKHGKLITTNKEFEDMKEIISKRYILIKCQKNHIWPIMVSNLLYRESWCPYCYQNKCQEYLLYYMNVVFGTKLSNITLTKAYGLKYKPGQGMLKFDGYNECVIVNGKKLKIACEFDGKQHDEYPNYYHNSLEEFEYAQKNDRIKSNHAKNHKTILIKIKEVQGFDKKCFEKNPNKVILEIISQFNEQVKELYSIENFRFKCKKDISYLKNHISNKKRSSLEKFL